MKKLLALALVVFGLAACQTEPEGFDVTVNGEVPVTVTVDLADAVGTRANSAEGAIDNEVVTSDDYTLRYALQVFNENGTASKDIKYKYTDATSVAFDLRLVPNRNYKFVVWADIVDATQTLTEDEKCDDLHYAIGADLRHITLNNSIIAWKAMDETRDAYTGVHDANNFNAAQNITIKLTRPFAKLRVVTTDIAELFDGVVPAKAVATYSTKHRTSFDAFAKTAGEATLQGVQHTFDIAGYNEGDDADTENNKTLFVDYFFAADEDDVVNFTLDVQEANGTTIKSNTFNTPIPVKRNFLTTIKGNVLTEGNKISIDIDDNFGENQENQVVRNTISSQAELDAAVLAGGKYIVIAHLDINNSGAGTTAVRFAATRAAVETVIDLNGYTITAKNTGDDALITVAEGSTLTFTGEGSVVLTSDSTGALIDNNGTVNIDGGTFTNNSTNSDTKLVENSDDAEVNVTGGSINLNEEVEGGKTTDYVALLAKAFADGGVYELPTDVTLSEPLTLAAGKTLTLNLNGKTIKQVKECTGNYNMIYNKGNLTITGDGKISFTDTGAGDPNFGWGSYTLRNEGTLVVENGVIEHLGEQNKGNGQPNVHMYCAIFQYSGSSTINGGRISTPTYRSARLWKGDMTINGGDFEGQLWVQAVDNTANLTINGGTFSPRGNDGSSVFVTNESNNKSYDVACAITGGFFNTKIGMSKPLACINGGTFTAAAAENTNPALLAEGYELVQEGDVWVVTPSYTVEGNVYTIYTVNGLKWLAEKVNGGDNLQGKTVNLAANIDLCGEEWTPIGNSSNSFSGIFDGQGYKVSNLVITGNNRDVGLFGFTTNGEIKNLTVENAKVSGYLDVAVVAGTPYTSKYTNITVKGHVEVNGFAYVGAVGGKNAYANWTDITVDVDKTSYVNANSIDGDTAYRTYVGGVVGFNGEGGHSFTNITSNINVKGSTCDIGGLFGIAHYGNKFVNCSCSGNVEIYAAAEAADAQEIGGIAGVWNNANDTEVRFDNCQFTGELKANIEDVEFYYNGLIGKPYSATGTGKLFVDGIEVGVEVENLVGLQAALNGNLPIVLKNVIVVEEGDVTLDLNGKTITAPTTSAFEVNGGKLTLQNGNVKAHEAIARAIGGEVVIESGKYVQTGTAVGSTPATYRYAIDAREGGKITINGGEFNSGNGMINVNADSEVVINGGKFENKVEKSMTRHFAYVSGKITVNDGEFNGVANSAAGGCFFCGAAKSGDITINGGKFISLWTSGSVNKIFESYYGGTINVTGGLFNTNGGIDSFVEANNDETTKAAYPYKAK